MTALDNLLRVARALAPIEEFEFVFAGASILPLLLDDPAANPPRATYDVDAVVNVLSYSRFEALQTRLSTCGIRVREPSAMGKARKCLFYFEEIEVDIMPVRTPEILSPSRMLELGFHAPEFHEVGDVEFLALSAPSFLAAKLEAFFERGMRQLPVSKDLDDIVTLFDGRLRLCDEVQIAHPEMRQFIADGIRKLLSDGYVLDLITDALRDLERERRLMEKFRALI